MITSIMTDPRYNAHTNPNHVERAQRLEAIEKAINASGLREQLHALPAREASEDELTAVHQPSYIDSIRRFGEQGGGELDPDTYMTSASWEAATWAAGGTTHLLETVINGESNNGFALVRPPGHHATASRAMGFCLINNIAVAARQAITRMGLERVAIVDYDVHHGNGTQDIFYQDPNILYISSHAYPFYPGTGTVDEIGTNEGQGTTLNLPLPLGLGDKGYQRAFEQVVIPALHQWKPQAILVSAGYDAHWNDPIGHMILSVSGYAQMTKMLFDAAAEICNGRIIFVLEGGYNLASLGHCVVSTLQVLSGQELDEDPLGVITAPEPEVSGIINTIRKNHPLFT